MNTAQKAAVAIVAVALAAVLVPYWLQRREQAQIAAECDALRQALAAEEREGGDTNRARALRVQLAACQARLSNTGADVDTGAAFVARLAGLEKVVREETAHYLTTAYSDPLKRRNTLGTIVKATDDAAAELTAMSAARPRPTAAQFRAARDIVNRLLLATRERAANTRANRPGYGHADFTWAALLGAPWMIGAQEPGEEEKAAVDDGLAAALERALETANRAAPTYVVER